MTPLIHVSFWHSSESQPAFGCNKRDNESEGMNVSFQSLQRHSFIPWMTEEKFSTMTDGRHSHIEYMYAMMSAIQIMATTQGLGGRGSVIKEFIFKGNSSKNFSGSQSPSTWIAFQYRLMQFIHSSFLSHNEKAVLLSPHSFLERWRYNS